MKLKDENYTILEKDYKNNKMKIQLLLSDIPSDEWNKTFNRIESDIDIFSVSNSSSIIVKLSTFEFKNTNFLLIVKNNIEKANNEISSDITKKNIYCKVYKNVNGVVAVHENLDFNGENSQLEKYLKQIVNNRTFE